MSEFELRFRNKAYIKSYEKYPFKNEDGIDTSKQMFSLGYEQACLDLYPAIERLLNTLKKYRNSKGVINLDGTVSFFTVKDNINFPANEAIADIYKFVGYYDEAASDDANTSDD